MKSVLGFFSALALGLIVAIVVATSLTSPVVQQSVGANLHIDYRSLMLGLALGLIIATLARIGWADLPRRFANWLAVNRFNFAVFGVGLICTAVIVLY